MILRWFRRRRARKHRDEARRLARWHEVAELGPTRSHAPSASRVLQEFWTTLPGRFRRRYHDVSDRAWDEAEGRVDLMAGRMISGTRLRAVAVRMRRAERCHR